MSGFIEGENRHQSVLFPESLDDYISEDSAVRVIDVLLRSGDGWNGTGLRPSRFARLSHGRAVLG